MMIDIKDIEFAYGREPVLQDVSCEVAKGDFVALVGPNGSGKSTLIKCIAGILYPRKGSISVAGRNIRRYTPSERAQVLGYVPQSESRRQTITVFDAILTGRKPYIAWAPTDNDLEITASIIRRLGLDSLTMRYVCELSGGQQQIIMIARALAQQPQVLLLDEPTANLDLRHQMEVMDLLKTLVHDDGITVIAAIHDVSMVLRYATRLVMLQRGRIFACGDRDIVTPENIEALYGVRAEIIQRHDFPCIIPLNYV